MHTGQDWVMSLVLFQLQISDRNVQLESKRGSEANDITYSKSQGYFTQETKHICKILGFQ